MSSATDPRDLVPVPPVPVHDPALFQLLMEHRKDTLRWRAENDKRLARVEELIEANTELTRQNADAAKVLADTMAAGRVVKTIVSWAGAVVVGLASIWYGIKTVVGAGGPPPGIGPTP